MVHNVVATSQTVVLGPMLRVVLVKDRGGGETKERKKEKNVVQFYGQLGQHIKSASTYSLLVFQRTIMTVAVVAAICKDVSIIAAISGKEILQAIARLETHDRDHGCKR